MTISSYHFLHKNKTFLVIVLVLSFVSYSFFASLKTKFNNVSSYEECVEARFVIPKDYPYLCKTQNKIFVREDMQLKNMEPEKSPLLLSSLEGSYIVAGTSTYLTFNDTLTATSSLSIRTFVNDDNFEDIIFVTKEGAIYYIALAYGLSNLEYARANALRLSTSTPTSISYTSNTITIDYGSGAKNIFIKDLVLSE
jgi:hypothetical protein